MNYYPFHIGDYLSATRHLSWEEDAAYRRLLDTYYTTEKPLPADERSVYRLVVAATESQREAVRTVLLEFFDLREDGWVNQRADAEISAMREKQEANEVRNAHERERMSRHRERRSAMFEQLRAAGVVPPWDVSTKDLQRLHEQHYNAPATHLQREHEAPATHLQREQAVSCNAPATAIPTPTPTPTPTPIEEEGERASAPPRKRSAPAQLAQPADVDEQTWQDWLALRKAKKAPVTATVLAQARTESDKAGMPLAAFLRVWCARGSQGLQAEWLKPQERAGPSAETAYQRSMRERVREFAPSVARKAPHERCAVPQNTAEFFNTVGALK